MFDIIVFVNRDASLARYQEIGRELAAAGMKIKGTYGSVGVIAGAVEDHGLLAAFQKIKDVTAVQEVAA